MLSTQRFRELALRHGQISPESTDSEVEQLFFNLIAPAAKEIIEAIAVCVANLEFSSAEEVLDQTKSVWFGAELEGAGVLHFKFAIKGGSSYTEYIYVYDHQSQIIHRWLEDTVNVFLPDGCRKLGTDSAPEKVDRPALLEAVRRGARLCEHCWAADEEKELRKELEG